MRKRLKRKRRCCPMCKAHKRGGGLRWSDRDLQELKAFERVKRQNERY